MLRAPPSRRGRATLVLRADVAELVDAHGSGPCGRKPVEVQVLSSASWTVVEAGLAVGHLGRWPRTSFRSEVLLSLDPHLRTRPIRCEFQNFGRSAGRFG